MKSEKNIRKKLEEIQDCIKAYGGTNQQIAKEEVLEWVLDD